MKSRFFKDRLSGLFKSLLIVQVLTLGVVLAVATKLSTSDSDLQLALNDTAEPQEDLIQALDPVSLERLVVEADELSTEPKQISYKVNRGENLATIWTKNGAPSTGALKAASAFKEASAPPLRAGESIELEVSLAGDVVGLTRKLDDGRSFILKGNSVDGYETEVLAADIEEVERAVSGVILSSFSASASDSEIPYTVVDEFVDLFSNRVEFRRDLQPGDSYTIKYVERKCRRSGTAMAPGKIISASLMTSDNMLASVSFPGKDGKPNYFDEKGHALGNYFLRYPLKFSRISSVFSEGRFHPVLNVKRPHYGVDFAAPTGTPVRSVANGIVVSAGFKSDAGNIVKIQHNERYSTAYLHLSKIASGLKPGTRVSRGQLIGAVGMTGLATGPHLHFSLYDNGRYVDPLKSKLPNLSESIQPIKPDFLMAALTEMQRQHQVIAVAAADSSQRQS